MADRPRIGLDARMVDLRTSGLGRYARELIRRLPALAPTTDFVIIKRPVMAREALSTAPNVREALVPGLLDHPANLLSAPAIDALGLDLYHSLHHFLPPRLHTPQVVMTLHDLIWVEHAELTFSGRWSWPKARANQVYGTATMWHALKRADHVIAISAHSRDRAMSRFGLPEGRFTVIHHGVDHEGAPMAPPEAEPPQPFLLSLGNSKPYKNLPTLLRAFAVVQARHPELELVVVGRGDSLPELRRLAERLGVDHRVTYTGMVDDSQVHALMRTARALVFPSLIEGFGFPAVEAMAAGCPVVTSDIPVIREIVGDAALLASPTSHEALAQAITRVVEDRELREELRQRGLAQAARLRWDDTAGKTLEVYRRLLPGATC